MRNKMFAAILILSLWVAMGFAATLALAQQRPERPKEPLPPTTTGVEALEPGTLELKVWTDKGNQNPTYYVGERIYVSFSVTKDSYVTIYDADSTGNVNILFPNPYHQDNLARKGRVYTIPTTNYEYDLVIKGPTGDEILYGIASSHIYYHWQYGVSPPPIWSDEWGTPMTWGHAGGGADSTLASRRFQKRLQNQPQIADLMIEFIEHQIETAKPTLVTSSECRFYVTVPPY